MIHVNIAYVMYIYQKECTNVCVLTTVYLANLTQVCVLYYISH